MAVKPKLPGGKGAKDTGQMKGEAMPEKFGTPMAGEPKTSIPGMGGMHNDIGEQSGFEDSGYIVKKGTPYGESAKFNYLPPGMDIDNQEIVDIRSMPYKELTDLSYPGDGWEPSPKKGE